MVVRFFGTKKTVKKHAKTKQKIIMVFCSERKGKEQKTDKPRNRKRKTKICRILCSDLAVIVIAKNEGAVRPKNNNSFFSD